MADQMRQAAYEKNKVKAQGGQLTGEMQGSSRFNGDDANHDNLLNKSNCHYLQGKKMEKACASSM